MINKPFEPKALYFRVLKSEIMGYKRHKILNLLFKKLGSENINKL